jgi:hypothetical protein
MKDQGLDEALKISSESLVAEIIVSFELSDSAAEITKEGAN